MLLRSRLTGTAAAPLNQRQLVRKQALRVPSSRNGRPARRSTCVCRASWLPDDLDDILQAGTLIASGIAIIGTAALATRTAPKRAKQLPQKVEPEDGFGYGVMGVVSLIPLVNWTAWVLPAIDKPERASLYYFYALLYAFPLLLDGFDIETYTVAMLVLGAVHVQVERIAATEPETFVNFQPVSGILSAIGIVAQKAVGFLGSLGGVVVSDAKEIARGTPRDELPASSKKADETSFDEVELKEFDRQLMAREAARRKQNKK